MNAPTRVKLPNGITTLRTRDSKAARDHGKGIAPPEPRRAENPAARGHAPKLTGNRCQCTACGECFNGTQPFDKHRVGSFAKPGEWQGTRRCLTVAEMEAAGFQRNAAGFWCERATKPHARPRAPVFSAPRAPLALQLQGGTPRVSKTRARALEPTP